MPRSLVDAIPRLERDVDPLLADLNEAQREAVTHPGGPLLVVAGAGSGKTRVITRRIAWRIRLGLKPWQVLAITFTNKAAGEMRERVQQTIGSGGAWVSTFHSLGARILRLEAEAAGLEQNFTIFDAADQLAVMREVLQEAGLRGTEHKPGRYLATVSRLKNLGEADVAAAVADDVDEASLDVDLRVFREYQRRLDESHALDFDDLLLRPVRLFEEREDVRHRFAGRFATLLIDEYQDTNQLQFRLARLLVRDHGDLCATGDPDQSIYRWRGADVRNILEFDRDFPGTHVVKLEENYRSTNLILRAASAVIRNNRMRLPRDLHSRLGDGERLRLVPCADEREEALRVVEGVEAARREGFGLDEMAVFYRTNACSRSLEQGLRLANLPYVIVGALEFYERREVKDLLAYLRVLVNPHDAIDLARVVNVPTRGIGARTLQRVRQEAARRGLPLRDVFFEPESVPGLRSDARSALARFAELLGELAELPRSPVLPLLDRLLERTGYVRWLMELDERLADDRAENVEELRRAVGEFDAAFPDKGIEEFLAETALLRSRDEFAEHEPRLTLMTLHSAKGLEFPVVTVSGLEEGLLPHARSLDSEEGLEEERRLFYVGLTRAQRRLTLTWCRRRSLGMAAFGALPSRFLSELPDEVVERPPNRFDAPWSVDDGETYEPDPCGEEPPFAVGDRVVHAQFGPGSVQDFSGFGPSAKVLVDFDMHGQKRLLLEYARLRKSRD